MFGVTDPFIIAVLVIGAIASVTDLARGRIPNWLCFPSMALGLAYLSTTQGWGGAFSSVFGILVGFAMYAWMFRLGVMGGGDVKLLMALGAWGGARFAFETGLMGILLGGVLAVFLLAFKGRLIPFLSKMKRFALTLMVKELEVETPQIDRKLTMPYGVPIAVAAAWIAIGDPFARWGVTRWN